MVSTRLKSLIQLTVIKQLYTGIMIKMILYTYKPLLVVLLMIFLAGCGSRYPLNIPEEQWVLMTPEQQFDARAQQAALDQAAHERRLAEARAREAQALERAAELEQRRRDASYGERVQCIIDPAEAYIRGRWEEVRPVAMDLVTGFQDEITVNDRRGRSSISLFARFDGQVVSVCRRSMGAHRPQDCAEIVATRNQFQRGVTQRIEQDRLIKGRMYCDLVPESSSVKPRRVR